MELTDEQIRKDFSYKICMFNCKCSSCGKKIYRGDMAIFSLTLNRYFHVDSDERNLVLPEKERRLRFIGRRLKK